MPVPKTVGDLEDAARRVVDKVVEYGKPIVHVAFIPAIIVLGLLYTEPRPSLAQLLTPM